MIVFENVCTHIDNMYHTPYVERWQYTEDDWFTENEDALMLMYNDLCDKLKKMGAQIDIESFYDFCVIVKRLTWIPQIGRASCRHPSNDYE